MILSPGSAAWPGTAPWLLAAGAVLAYALAMLPSRSGEAGASNWPAGALLAGWVLHLGLLVLDIGGWGQSGSGARLGFAPVLSITVWLVIAVHAVESRMVPLPAVRRVLAIVGAVAVLLAWWFPGEIRPLTSRWAPLHFVLGVASYGLFGVAVLHALMLDAAERRLRERRAPEAGSFGLPLLQLERLTFRFVAAGFVVLTATLLLGLLTSGAWSWLDRKAVLSLLGWAVFAALLVGRHWRGWRGRRATAWLYGGAILLLLAYAGSRFVMEVILHRSP
jgi:ABC-type uncharacterized transport system permease subunit